MNKDYQPIPMRPLTMRGVFGITWAVTKRRFFAGVMYTLIWVLIAAAVLALCAAPAVVGIIANNAGQGGGVAALVVLSVILMFVAALAIWLVLGPIMSGGLYTEMSMRIYGQSSTLSQLFKRTGYTLKRYFTLNLCQYVGRLVAGIVLSLISSVLTGIITAGSMMSMVMNAARSGLFDCREFLDISDVASFGAGFAASLIIIWLINMVLAICVTVPLEFTYPVAVNEDKKNFSALSRGLNLAFKRYGRMLGASLIVMLAFIVIALILSAIFGVALGISLAAGSTAAVVVCAAVMAIAMLFLAAIEANYSAALYTVLYYDAYTREFRDSVNDPVFNDLVSNAAPVEVPYDAPVQYEPIQHASCDASVNESEPEAQSEPETPAEEPEFVEKNDYNETNNTQE